MMVVYHESKIMSSPIWYPEVKISNNNYNRNNKQKINSIYKVHQAKIMGNLNSNIWTIPQCSAVKNVHSGSILILLCFYSALMS